MTAPSNEEAIVNMTAANTSPQPEEWQWVPKEITGKMWSAGRQAFQQYAEEYRQRPSHVGASVVADVAAAEIFKALLSAAPASPAGLAKHVGVGEIEQIIADHPPTGSELARARFNDAAREIYDRIIRVAPAPTSGERA